MKGFYIEISNNLLTPTHRKKMGSAIWEFVWCIDKITKIENNIGYVLGGSIINLAEMKKDLGIHETNISSNLNKLQEKGYINIEHKSLGIILSVNKAQKRFSQKAKPSFSDNTNANSVYANTYIIDKTVDKTVLDSTKSNRTKSSFPKPDYDTVLVSYQKIKGIELRGPEFDPVMQTIKTMFLSKRTPQDIISCMEWLAQGSEEWMENWTIRTVKLKLPEFLAKKDKPISKKYY